MSTPLFAPQPTPFIGRHVELADITRLLVDPACRLLTLVGPGGIGKTRLAIEVAAAQTAKYDDGVYFVPLQPLTTPDLIVTDIATCLGFQFSGFLEPHILLSNYLKDKSLLLVLDNFEHLLDGAGLLAEALAAAPRLKLLVTSRIILNLQEEWRYPVHGLRFSPENAFDSMQEQDAVQLFIHHARRAQPDFSLESEQAWVAHICRLVEGMPLALELAASWLKRLPCREIAFEIERGLDILETPARNVESRHRSMRALLEHSWNLLTEAERAVLMKLSGFRGGFLRPAAAEVAGATLPVLSALVDKSMLRVHNTGRYDIHELLRQYAEEKLAETPGAQEQLQDRHTVYYIEFLSKLETKLKGPEQLAALDEIDAEIDNIRTAWGRASALRQEQELDKTLEGLALFYMMRSRSIEGERVFGYTLQYLERVENALLAKVLLFLARFTATRDWNKAIELGMKGLPLWLAHVPPGETGFALGVFQLLAPTVLYSFEGSSAELVRQIENYLITCCHQGDRWSEGWALFCLGELALELKINEAAHPYLQDSLAIFRSLGNPWAATFPIGNLVRLQAENGQYEEANDLLHEAQATNKTMGDVMGVVHNCWQFAEIAHAQGHDREVQSYIHEALRLALEIQSHPRWLMVLSRLIMHLLRRNGATVQVVEVAALADADLRHMPYRNRYAIFLQGWLDEQLKTLQAELPAQVFAEAKRRGEASDPEALTRNLIEQFRIDEQGLAVAAARAQGLVDPLSERELEVLRLLDEGLTNDEIGNKLCIALGTVKAHTKNIYDKLTVHNRSQAVAQARKLKLL